MGVELKSCPFCGNNEPYIEIHDQWWSYEGLVVCNQCGGRVYKYTRREEGYTKEKTRELVIAAWNRRAET